MSKERFLSNSKRKKIVLDIAVKLFQFHIRFERFAAIMMKFNTLLFKKFKKLWIFWLQSIVWSGLKSSWWKHPYLSHYGINKIYFIDENLGFSTKSICYALLPSCISPLIKHDQSLDRRNRKNFQIRFWTIFYNYSPLLK